MKIFATLDIDNDGDVTEEEFVQGCLKDEELVIVNIILAINIITNIKRVPSKVSPTSRSTSPSRLNHTNYTNEGGGSQRRQDKATTSSTQQRDYAQKEKVRVYVAISIVIIIIITITLISIIVIIFVIIITIGNIFAPYVVPTLIFPSICICLLCYQRRTQLFSKHFRNSTIAWTQKLPNP